MSVGIGFYDELEMLMTARKHCEIVFKKDVGRSVINGTIADLSVSGQDASLTMVSGLTIKLADILEVNGKNQSTLC